MKKIYGFLGAVALLALASCSSDEPLVNNGGYQGDDGRVAYIKTTIALPSNGSRSSTDDTGDSNSNGDSNSGNKDTDRDDNTVGSDVENGKDYENNVRSMILVIADRNDRYLTHLVITGMSAASVLNGKYVFETTARIPYSTLSEAYGEGGLFHLITSGTKPMYLYAFCNFTNNMLTMFNNYQAEVQALEPAKRDDTLLTKWRDFQGGVEEKASMAGETPQSQASIWSKNSFMMANSEVYESTFPETLEEWDVYADDRNPLHLTDSPWGKGAINVERVSARIDFRDASPEGDLVYPIIYDQSTSTAGSTGKQDKRLVKALAEENGKLNLYSIRLSRMVLVNMSKKFYYLRRVSDDGTMNNAEYVGPEINLPSHQNFVVDWDYAAKAATTDGYGGENGITVKNASDHFNFPLFSTSSTPEQTLYNNMGSTYGWYISNISDVLKGEEDQWDGQWKTGKPENGYHIWRYVTENTLPSADDQKTIQSTGIIFKGALQAGTDAATHPELMSPALVEALEKVKTAPTEKPTMDDGSALPAIYSFHNILYGGVPDIVAAALADGNGGALFFAVDQILNKWYYIRSEGANQDGKKVFKYLDKAPQGTDGVEFVQLNVVIADEILNGTPVTDNSESFVEGYDIDFKDSSLSTDDPLYEFKNSMFIQECPEQQITVFIPTMDDKTEGWGYYCYYFYWMRHNDNGLSGKMQPMEFATVRNNVYKIAVTGITKVGHPRDARRDPDPVDPGDPDEEPERSIKIEVNVLPWVVRVNDIIF